MGATAHLAEPANTAAARRKRRAETDRADATDVRSHLARGDLPESWVEHVQEIRTLARLHKDLLDERGGWRQRVAATLLHQGVPTAVGSMAYPAGRAALAEVHLSTAGRTVVDAGLRQIDRLTDELTAADRAGAGLPQPAGLPRPASGALRRCVRCCADI